VSNPSVANDTPAAVSVGDSTTSVAGVTILLDAAAVVIGNSTQEM
jgi:hypothetical protein